MLFKSTTFAGKMLFEQRTYELRFRLAIDGQGEVRFVFPKIPLLKETLHLYDLFNAKELTEFSLTGTSAGGCQFSTDTLHFNSFKSQFSERTGSTFAFGGQCRAAILKWNRQLTETCPRLVYRTKEFECFGQLAHRCPLGTVQMAGNKGAAKSDEITGYLTVTAEEVPPDINAWHDAATKLLDPCARIS